MFKLLAKFLIIPLFITAPTVVFNKEEDIKGIITTYFNEEAKAIQGEDYTFNWVTEEYKEELNCKLDFLKKWCMLQQYKFKKYDQKINISEIRKSEGLIKVFVERNVDFNLNNFVDCQKSLGERFCIHVVEGEFGYKINKIIYEEESPEWFINEYEGRDGYRSSGESYKDKLKNINKINGEYKKFLRVSDKKEFGYNREATIDYAEKYALDYNKSYKEFDSYGQGGDCTNFVSQCLKAGGLETSKQWSPYTNAWILVNDCREYLVNNKIAKEYNYISPNMVGGVVQFYNVEKQKWAHSGIITKYTDGDYLFCCHSYDKLNYPLSMRYPMIYPKIRMLIVE